MRCARTSLEDARQLLARSALFRGLVASEREELISRARLRHCAAGESIFCKGAPGDCMMALLSGTVWISIGSAEGREIVLAIVHPGEMFGEIALLDGRDRTADARAMTPCDLARLDRRDVLEFVRRRPNTWPRLVEILCDRLRAADGLMSEIAMQRLPARLAKALLRVLDAQERAEGCAGNVKLCQRELGSIVGAARESVNKCLREWHRSGLIRIERSAITIPDPASLREIAELPL